MDGEMKPINFKGKNVTFAENQPEYLPLPAHKTENGLVTSCWKCSLLDRIRILLFGRIWVQNLTFNKPLQPQKICIGNPINETV